MPRQPPAPALFPDKPPILLPILATLVAATAAAAAPQGNDQTDARQQSGLRQTLERAVRQYFAADAADDRSLADAARLARGHEDLLAEILKTKSFVAHTGRVARRGIIDTHYRFVDDPAAANPALFCGPATAADLHPFVVYVPDATDSAGFVPAIAREGTERGWYVFLVPDERRDNRWNPTAHEHRRHAGPLRDLLLQYPIDPDRVFMIGSGRGGHATWDVGLLSADRWAGIYPCNGGLVHEGGYKATGGVFLDNARCFTVFTVYNTTFDHGIESCRFAAQKFEQWGYRFEAVEEPRMRVMGITEATGKLAAVVRDAHPRAIHKRFNHLEDGGHYWLRALDRPRKWDPTAKILIAGTWPQERDKQLELVWARVRDECAFVSGSIANNRIDVVAKGLGRIRVWFDPELLDFRAKVTVVVNGKTRPPLAVSRKPEVLLRHVHETGDTARLYWDCIDLRIAQ